MESNCYLPSLVLSQEGSSHNQQLTPIGASTSKVSGEAAYKDPVAERELSSREIPGAAQAQLLLLHRIKVLGAVSAHGSPPPS